MPETEKPVQTFQVDYLCDECGEPMRSDGRCLTSYPAQYPHVCRNGHTKTFSGATYPRFTHK